MVISSGHLRIQLSGAIPATTDSSLALQSTTQKTKRIALHATTSNSFVYDATIHITLNVDSNGMTVNQNIILLFCVKTSDVVLFTRNNVGGKT